MNLYVHEKKRLDLLIIHHLNVVILNQRGKNQPHNSKFQTNRRRKKRTHKRMLSLKMPFENMHTTEKKILKSGPIFHHILPHSIDSTIHDL